MGWKDGGGRSVPPGPVRTAPSPLENEVCEQDSICSNLLRVTAHLSFLGGKDHVYPGGFGVGVEVFSVERQLAPFSSPAAAAGAALTSPGRRKLAHPNQREQPRLPEFHNH